MRLRGWNGIDLAPQPKNARNRRRQSLRRQRGCDNRSAKVASQGALCPSLNEITVPTGPSCVLCRQLLKPCLTVGCNGGMEDGFGRCCWESYLEALFSFSPTGCPDSKPLFRKAASNDRPYASRVRAFSSVELLGSVSEPS